RSLRASEPGRCGLAVALALALAASCGHSGPALPGRPPTVDVDMREYRFDFHAEIRAGRTVIRARNRGHLVHELVLIYLAPEVPPIDQQLHSSERLVVPTIVSLHARAPGRSGTFAVDLDPGR